MTESDKRINTIGFYFKDADNPYAEDVRLEFDVYPDMHISKLVYLCRLFALTLGYAEASVDQYFGENVIEDE